MLGFLKHRGEHLTCHTNWSSLHSTTCAAVDRVAGRCHWVRHSTATATARAGDRDRACRWRDSDVRSSGECLVLEGPAGVRNAEELVSGANRRQAMLPGDGRHARRFPTPAMVSSVENGIRLLVPVLARTSCR